MAYQASGEHPVLKRSSTVIPARLDVTEMKDGSSGVELLQCKTRPAYVSLKDLMAAEPPQPWLHSPEAVRTVEVRIRNRLVRRAAQAYVYPGGPWARPRPPPRRTLLGTFFSCFQFLD